MAWLLQDPWKVAAALHHFPASSQIRDYNLTTALCCQAAQCFSFSSEKKKKKHICFQ